MTDSKPKMYVDAENLYKKNTRQRSISATKLLSRFSLHAFLINLSIPYVFVIYYYPDDKLVNSNELLSLILTL